MAALTATNWTVTVNDRFIETKNRRTFCKLVLPTDGTYPSNGIPIPAYGDMGFVRNVDYINILDPDATAYVVKYDKDNTSIRIFSLASTGGAELATTATVGSTVLGTVYVEGTGW